MAGQVAEDMVVAAARVLAYPTAGADRAAVVLSRAADRSEQASTTLSTVVLADVAPKDILAAQASLEVLNDAIEGLRSCALAAGNEPTTVEVEGGQCTEPSALSGAQSAAEAVLPAAGALAEGAGLEVGQTDDLIEALRGQARREAQAGSSFDITDQS